MVSDEEVKFRAATLISENTGILTGHLRSSDIDAKNVYTGAQIFINSDRVILNSKINEISLFSKTEINLSSIKKITLDTEGSVAISANSDITLQAFEDVFFKGNTVSVEGNIISYKAIDTYSILAKKIFIGTSNDPSEPVVLGASLSKFLSQLIDIILINLPLAVVVTPTGAGTIRTPALSTALRTLKQTQLGINARSAVFNSTNTFVSK
jgi:hypothetical protein